MTVSIDPAAKSAREAGVLQGITLLVPSTLATMAIVVLIPILPLLFQHFANLPGAEYRVPMLLTIPALCLIVGSPVAGWIADRFGRRRVLICAMGGYSIVGILPIFLDNYWPIFISRVGVGLLEALVLTLSTTLIGDYFSGTLRDRWLGYQIAVASLSATVLIFLGGVLSTFGWRGPFAIYGSAAAMMLGIMLFTWETTPPNPKHSASERAWGDFPWAGLGGICAITVFASILFYMFQIQMPLLLQARGIPPSAKSGLLQAAVSLSVPLGAVLFRYVTAVPPRRLVSFAFVLMGSGCLAMSLSTSLAGLLVAAFIGQIGAGIVMPTLLTWAVRQLSFAQRGRGTGMWQGVFALGQFLMPILVTLSSKVLGGLNGGIAALGVMALLGAAVLAVSLAWPSRKAVDSRGKKIVIS